MNANFTVSLPLSLIATIDERRGDRSRAACIREVLTLHYSLTDAASKAQLDLPAVSASPPEPVRVEATLEAPARIFADQGMTLDGIATREVDNA